ncbi:hypothetical protein Pla52n_18550 [Stieleria varia]|uniref:Uncharacterized protein n=1 Tax=Stieleria varia TaxID=2528005 RepID=A0A5C6B1E1_9BACT|nr:hypothetical protein Pla52n_18550 [Stieleria varia]
MIRQGNRDSTEWTPLTTGALTTFAKRARSQRRRKQLVRAGTPVALLPLLLLLVSLGSSDAPQPSQPRFGGITCTDVVSHLDSLSSGDLAPSLVTAIQTHLLKCPDCRKRMESMQKPQSVAHNKDIRNTSLESSSPHSQFLVASVE